MSTGQSETPVQEAISIISIAAILLAVGCYVACMGNAAVISPAMFWVAVQVYSFFPSLNGLHSPQVPMLVAAATVSGLFWLLMMPLAPILARAFNSQQMASLERQTIKLKRNRAQIQKQRKDRDGFNAS